MSSDFTVAAEPRNDNGKGASRRLRHEGKIPAIIYGTDKEPAMVSLTHNIIARAAEDEAFFSHVLTIDVAGTKEKVIIKDMQRHPAKLQIMHMDFLRIDENKELHVNVPLHFMNEAMSSGVKEGGIVTHLITELEVACLPSNLPEYIEINVEHLNLNESIHISDIIMPEGVRNLVLEQGVDHDQAVANVSMPRGEKIVEEEETEETDGEEAGNTEE